MQHPDHWAFFSISTCIMSKSDAVMADITKAEVETIESMNKPTQTARGKDKAAELLAANDRIVVTPEDNKRVLRKIDLMILPILLSVYFLQSLDKTTLSYASVFGLIKDAKLNPNSQQYSWLGSIVYIAQMIMQPIVAYFLVKFPTGKFIGIMVFTWGIILSGMAGAHNFTGLMVTRFLLGAFEAAVGKSRMIVAISSLTCCSTRFHRRRSDVVQASRTNEPQRSLVFDAGHSQHPWQSVVLRSRAHPLRPALLIPDHLSLLRSTLRYCCGLRLHLHAR
jgi:hypothetical protein